MKRTSKEKRNAMMERVLQELEAYRNGWIEEISTNQELADWLGCCGCTIWNILKEDVTLRKQREEIAHSAHSKMRIKIYGNPGANLSPEERHKNGISGYQAGLAKLTDAQRSEFGKISGKRAYLAGLVNQTVEQRAELGKRTCEVYGNPSRNMTHEQRVQIGRQGYKKTHGNHTPEQISEIARLNYKKGIGKLTAKQRSEQGKRYYHKNLGRLTPEQKSKAGKLGGHIAATMLTRRRDIKLNDCFYDSYEEAAVSSLLQKYCGYFPKLGENLQVDASGSSIDFLLNGIFIEYHPIILYPGKIKGKRSRGDIPEEEYASYREKINGMSHEEKKKFNYQYQKCIAERYYNGRLDRIKQSGLGNKLVLITDKDDLYGLISKFYPSMTPEALLKEFRQIKNEVKSQNKERKENFESRASAPQQDYSPSFSEGAK